MSNIAHYLRTGTGENVFEEKAIRIMSNMEDDGIIGAVVKSLESNTPVIPVGRSFHVLGVNTGNHIFPLLERADSRGVGFRIAVFPTEMMGQMATDDILGMVGRANFAWADASKATFIKFDGVEEWGLEPLGLNFRNCKKLPKRLVEVTRLSGNYVVDESGTQFTMREFTTPDGEMDEYYDGGNVISPRLAEAMGFEDDRGNGRFDTPLGLVKGDFIVSNKIDVDLLYHTENLKDELSTDGFFLATALKHDPLHELRHDAQTSNNFRFFLSEERMIEDLRRMYYDWHNSIEEGGDLHEYLQNQSQCFDDPIAIDLDMIQMADSLESQADLLNAVGIAPASFSNITFTRTGALTRRMDAGRKEFGKRIFNKMFIPATNALLGAVSTYEFATNMCGFDYPFEDGSRTFFDPRIGLVMSGKRFVETYDLHGGWDGDDSLSLFAIRLFCSDEARLATLVGHGVIDANLVVPANADDAVVCGLAIRRPNGPGEYAIESVSDDMPWHFYDMDKIESFDVADLPMCQHELREYVEFGEIPTSVSYDREFGREEAFASIIAQTQNPGVGGFANLLIAWSATFGWNSVPEYMLGTMEDVVDCVQQTSDEVSFMAISEDINRLWVEWITKVLAEGVTVDGGILATRVPEKIGGGEDAIEVASAVISAGLVGPGPSLRLMRKYDDAITRLGKDAKDLANIVRNNTEMALRIKGISVASSVAHGLELKKWCEGWCKMANIELKTLDKASREEMSGVINPVVRRTIQTKNRIKLEQKMDQLVQTILDSRHDQHDLVLALYKYVVTPRENWVNGDTDRIFVQPCSPGNVSMLQLFIEAVSMRGLLDEY